MTTSKGGRPRKPSALRLIPGGKMPVTEPQPTPKPLSTPSDSAKASRDDADRVTAMLPDFIKDLTEA